MSVADKRVQFTAKGHLVEMVRLDAKQWRVFIDGKPYATFCSLSRARFAARAAAQFMEFSSIRP
ncbi:MAG: hypothetical protein JST54_11690 [Deltaproteobacteria bacterium]|nr:hypothetical protein [Deltaproteobacteria bacterium]